MRYLNYHAINDEERQQWCHRDSRWSVPKALFERHLGRLMMEGWVLQSLDDALAQPHERGVALTFDDGHQADQRTTWPLLDRLGLRGAFFVSLSNFSGSADPRWAELRSMHRAGHAVGAHGVSHRSFHRLASHVQRDEMRRSKEVLEDRIGEAIRHFAFPYGHVTKEALRHGDELGFDALFTTLGFVREAPLSPRLIHRFSVRANLHEAALMAMLSESQRPRSWGRALIAVRRMRSGIPWNH